ncbi:MAG: hypothetical protein NT072_09970 [Deltaproteobacteria bacterium]|nr:hypothetical protein [Deltaproteobacteria bacterium]
MDNNELAQNEIELLRVLICGEKEIEASEGHDLDEVLAEADFLITRFIMSEG